MHPIGLQSVNTYNILLSSLYKVFLAHQKLEGTQPRQRKEKNGFGVKDIPLLITKLKEQDLNLDQTYSFNCNSFMTYSYTYIP